MRASVAGVPAVEIPERRATEEQLVRGDLLECDYCPELAVAQVVDRGDNTPIEPVCHGCLSLAAIFWHNHRPHGVVVLWPADGDYPAQTEAVA